MENAGEENLSWSLKPILSAPLRLDQGYAGCEKMPCGVPKVDDPSINKNNKQKFLVFCLSIFHVMVAHIAPILLSPVHSSPACWGPHQSLLALNSCCYNCSIPVALPSQSCIDIIFLLWAFFCHLSRLSLQFIAHQKQTSLVKQLSIQGSR